MSAHRGKHANESSLPRAAVLGGLLYGQPDKACFALCCARCSHAGPPPLLSHTRCAGVTSCPPFVPCAALRCVVCEWLRMRPACTNEADEGRAMQRAGRWYTRCRPCCLLAAPAASWGEIGYSTVLRVGPHLEIPTRVPYSASRAAGEPPAPGAKVFTEHVRHLLGLIY